jgi:hypothetical protein
VAGFEGLRDGDGEVRFDARLPASRGEAELAPAA